MNTTDIVNRIALVTFLAAAVAVPGDALGQTGPTQANPAADEIHDKAVALYTDPVRHGQAAHLLRQECELRAPEDPLAYRCLSMSARLFYYTGELLDARTMMEKAAVNALQRGDVVSAARSYIEAAWVAEEQNRGGPKTAELVGKARSLSASPLLTETERAWILARIDVPAPELASADED